MSSRLFHLPLYFRNTPSALLGFRLVHHDFRVVGGDVRSAFGSTVCVRVLGFYELGNVAGSVLGEGGGEAEYLADQGDKLRLSGQL